jgi:predicted transcriptional regulator
MASTAVHPTKLELTILRVLWERGPRSVREIQAILNESKPTGYTTVLKMLQIMTDKGLVERDESVRPQRYRAQHEDRTQRRLRAFHPARLRRLGPVAGHARARHEEAVA